MSTALPTSPITPGINQSFNPNITRVARFDLSITQVTTLFSAPIVLLPALTGYYYHIMRGQIIRSGSPFATSPGSTQIRINLATPFAVLTWVSANSPFTQAGTKWSSFRQFSNNNAFLGGVDQDDSTTGFGSKAVSIACTVGDNTVSGPSPGSTCVVILAYEIWPTYVENVGSY